MRTGEHVPTAHICALNSSIAAASCHVQIDLTVLPSARELLAAAARGTITPSIGQLYAQLQPAARPLPGLAAAEALDLAAIVREAQGGVGAHKAHAGGLHAGLAADGGAAASGGAECALCRLTRPGFGSPSPAVAILLLRRRLHRPGAGGCGGARARTARCHAAGGGRGGRGGHHHGRRQRKQHGRFRRARGL